MKRKILIAGLFLGGVAASNLSAQKYLGLSNSNYSGVYGSQYNPAKLTDEKVKVAVNLVSVNGLVNNDYYKFKNLNSFGGFTLDELGNGASHNGGNGALINLGIVGEVLGPSFQFTVNNKLGFGFSSRVRLFGQGKNINSAFLNALNGNLGTDNPGLATIPLVDNTGFGINTTALTDLGVKGAYAVIDNNDLKLSLGASVKLYKGAGLNRFESNGYNLIYNNNPSNPTITATNINWDLYTNLNPDKSLNNYGFSDFFGGATGFGGDFGAELTLSQQNLKRDITKIIQGKNALVAVSVMNSKGKTEVNINGNKKVPMLSVFKFHIALAVLDLVDRGILDLEQNIFVKKSELLENTWSPIRDKYPNGNVNIPLREIIEYTVSQSDNNGCDILLRLIGGVDTVQKFIESKGIKDFAIKYNEEEMNKNGKSIYSNYTTANASSRLLQKFYNGEIISESSRDFLFRIMYETSTGADRLISLLPPDVIVAHKTGTSGIVSGIQAATNDVGIIILPDDEYYTISVFVINSKENTSTNEKIIADISKTVWDYYFRNK